MIYLRARFYDPETGRFISRDPIGLIDGLNTYIYCKNDPINLNDSSGTKVQGEQEGDGPTYPIDPIVSGKPVGIINGIVWKYNSKSKSLIVHIGYQNWDTCPHQIKYTVTLFKGQYLNDRPEKPKPHDVTRDPGSKKPLFYFHESLGSYKRFRGIFRTDAWYWLSGSKKTPILPRIGGSFEGHVH